MAKSNIKNNTNLKNFIINYNFFKKSQFIITSYLTERLKFIKHKNPSQILIVPIVNNEYFLFKIKNIKL